MNGNALFSPLRMGILLSLLLLCGCESNRIGNGLSITLWNLPQQARLNDLITFDLVVRNDSVQTVWFDVSTIRLEDNFFVRVISVNHGSLSEALEEYRYVQQGFPGAPEGIYVSLARNEYLVIPISTEFYKWETIFGHDPSQPGPVIVRAGIRLDISKTEGGDIHVEWLRSPTYSMTIKPGS